jgi:hypothetical protein
MVRPSLIAVLLLILLSLAAAQFRTGNLKVRVTFTDGRRCDVTVRVQLMGGASTSPVAEGYTNDAGMTEFNNVETGNYHLIVSGDGIDETDSGVFEVDNRRGSQFRYVAVRRRRDTDQAASNISGAPTIGTADLKIPEGAAKEFDELIAKQDWKKAIDQLNNALAIYPQYSAAYNNLGVIYARLGDRNQEREALHKAISLNDHFAPAFVNLARMAIVDRDFAAAEALLDKASAMDPANSQTLVLLLSSTKIVHARPWPNSKRFSRRSRQESVPTLCAGNCPVCRVSFNE